MLYQTTSQIISPQISHKIQTMSSPPHTLPDRHYHHTVTKAKARIRQDYTFLASIYDGDIREPSKTLPKLAQIQNDEAFSSIAILNMRGAAVDVLTSTTQHPSGRTKPFFSVAYSCSTHTGAQVQYNTDKVAESFQVFHQNPDVEQLLRDDFTDMDSYRQLLSDENMDRLRQPFFPIPVGLLPTDDFDEDINGEKRFSSEFLFQTCYNVATFYQNSVDIHDSPYLQELVLFCAIPSYLALVEKPVKIQGLALKGVTAKKLYADTINKMLQNSLHLLASSPPDNQPPTSSASSTTSSIKERIPKKKASDAILALTKQSNKKMRPSPLRNDEDSDDESDHASQVLMNYHSDADEEESDNESQSDTSEPSTSPPADDQALQRQLIQALIKQSKPKTLLDRVSDTNVEYILQSVRQTRNVPPTDIRLSSLTLLPLCFMTLNYNKGPFKERTGSEKSFPEIQHNLEELP